ncbi:hypothetical protein ACIRU8_29210 [Streptomyces sp. NPDC101175]|uniref:hypothetical protein n=1 Tax=Streptomyces sp. NPDC101175 TaxID=3366123 RepID=UPI003836EBB8
MPIPALLSMDYAGPGVLCRAHNRARLRHGGVRLVTESALFLRTLRHTGLTA